VIWFIFGSDIEILTDWNVEDHGNKNFDIDTFGGHFKVFEEQITLEL